MNNIPPHSYQIKLISELAGLLLVEKIVNISAVIVDFSVAGTLIYYLFKARTGYKKGDSIVNRLILYTLSTGLMTSFSAIIALIFVCIFVVSPWERIAELHPISRSARIPNRSYTLRVICFIVEVSSALAVTAELSLADVHL